MSDTTSVPALAWKALLGSRIAPSSSALWNRYRRTVAGTHLIQRLGKEVVVDGEAQLVICLVVDLILAERYIANGKVIEVPPVGGLKSSHRDVCFGVELTGNTSRNRV